MNKLYILVLLLLTSVSTTTFGQELNIKDGAEIMYRAEILLNEYGDLLNTVSNNGLSLTESKGLISNSFSKSSSNRIFYDNKVIVEDDIDPRSNNTNKGLDMPIESYLNKLELVYTKSDDYTITFSNINISNVKQRDYIYVKVFFESLFESSHKEVKIPYKQVKRVAEVRADRVDNKWKVYITALRFTNDNEVHSDTLNDVKLVSDQFAADGDPEQEKILQLTAMREQARRAMESEKREREKQFNDAIRVAEEAYQQEDYPRALIAYRSALDIKPRDAGTLIRIKLLETKDLFEEYKLKAELARKVRDYNTAKSFYLKALGQKPNNTELRKELDILNQKIRDRETLESKFIAGNLDGAIKDYDKAIKGFKKAGNNQSIDVSDYFFGRGKCYEAKSNYKQALEDYTEAINLDKNYQEALYQRAKLYIHLARSSVKDDSTTHLLNAHADYSIIISNDEKNADNYVQRALLRESLSNPQGATDDYETAVTLAPKNHKIHYVKGLYHVRRLEANKAVKHFTKTIELNPEHAGAYFHRGLLYINPLKQVQDAANDFNAAKKIGINESMTRQITAVYYNYFYSGLYSLNNKEYSLAMDNFIDALTINPDSSQAWFYKAETFYKMQNYSSAIQNYDKAVHFNPNYSQAYYQRGLSNFNLKNYLESLPDFAKAHELDNRKYEAMMAEGHSHQILQNYNEGIEAYTKAIQTILFLQKNNQKTAYQQQSDPVYKNSSFYNDEMATAHFNLGKCYYYNNNPRQAITELTTSIKLNKKFMESYYWRGVSFHTAFDFKKALDDHNKAIEGGFRNEKSYYARAKTFQALNKHQEAVNNYSQAMRLDSAATLLDIFYLTGKSHIQLKAYHNALTNFETHKALHLGELPGSFYAELGFIRLNLLQSNEAITDFNTSLSLEEDNPEALYGIACSYSQQNDIDKALDWFEKAFKTKKILKTRVKKDTLTEGIARNKQFKKLVNNYL